MTKIKTNGWKWTPMDYRGDRFARHDGRWAKISKLPEGGYAVARGYEGERRAVETTRHRWLACARVAAEDWLARR